MNRQEIISRLENLKDHAVHTPGELPFCMSLDDGIAICEAIDMLNEQGTKNAPAQWISVKERLPEQFEYVLLYTADGLVTYGYRIKDCWFERGMTAQATHWMPPPGPPEGQEARDDH